MSRPVIDPEVFQAAVENVKRNSLDGNALFRGKHGDALKWRILMALEGAAPKLAEAEKVTLITIAEHINGVLETDRMVNPPADSQAAGYASACRDIRAILLKHGSPAGGAVIFGDQR